jgi:hypothetical protein
MTPFLKKQNPIQQGLSKPADKVAASTDPIVQGLKDTGANLVSSVRDNTVTTAMEMGKKALSDPKALIAGGLKGGVAGVAGEGVVNSIQTALVGDVSSNPFAESLKTTANRIGGGALGGAAVGGAPGAVLGAIGGGITDIANNVVGIASALPELATTMYGAYVEAPQKEKALQQRLAQRQTPNNQQGSLVASNSDPSKLKKFM